MRYFKQGCVVKSKRGYAMIKKGVITCLSASIFTVCCSMIDFPHLSEMNGSLCLSGKELHDIDSIDFGSGAYSEVKALDLSNNGIQSFELRHFLQKFPKLQKLNLSRNLIHSIAKGALEGIPDRFAVDLSYNRINHVDDGAFKTIGSHGIVIDLRGNLLNSIIAHRIKDTVERDTYIYRFLRLMRADKVMDGCRYSLIFSLASIPAGFAAKAEGNWVGDLYLYTAGIVGLPSVSCCALLAALRAKYGYVFPRNRVIIKEDV